METKELIWNIYAACVDHLYADDLQISAAQERSLHAMVDRGALICPEDVRMKLHRVVMEFARWLSGDEMQWKDIAGKMGNTNIRQWDQSRAYAGCFSRRDSIMTIGTAYLDAEAELMERMGFCLTEGGSAAGESEAGQLRHLVESAAEYNDFQISPEQENIRSYLCTLLLEKIVYTDKASGAVCRMPNCSGSVLAADGAVGILRCVFQYYFGDIL